MNPIDICIVVILAIGLIRGIMKGFVLELTGLLSVLIGIVGAYRYASDVNQYISPYLNWEPKYVQLTAFILTFLVIASLFALIGKALTKFLNFIALGMLNRIVGGIFGLLKMSIIVFFVVLIISSANKKIGFLKDNEVVADSITYSFFNDLIDFYFPDMMIYAKENKLLPGSEEDNP